MRIAILIPSLKNLGPTIVAKRQFEHFRDQGIDVDLLFLDGDCLSNDYESHMKKIGLLDFRLLRHYDLIQSHGIRPDFLASLGKIFHKNLKIVSTLHIDITQDFHLNYKKSKFTAWLIEYFWIRILRRFDHVVLLTQAAKRKYASKLKSSSVIYNGVSDFTDNHDTNKNKAIESAAKCARSAGLYVCGVHAFLKPGKGIDQLVRVLPTQPKLALILAGSGSEEESLKKLAVDLSVQDRVFFVGYIDNANKYLGYYDLFSLPSFSEGFPLSVLEAASASLPLLLSEIPPHVEAFGDNDAMFFKLSDITSLSQSIEYLLDNLSTFGERARRRFEDHYTIQHMCNCYMDTYKTIVVEQS